MLFLVIVNSHRILPGILITLLIFRILFLLMLSSSFPFIRAKLFYHTHKRAAAYTPNTRGGSPDSVTSFCLMSPLICMYTTYTRLLAPILPCSSFTQCDSTCTPRRPWDCPHSRRGPGTCRRPSSSNNCSSEVAVRTKSTCRHSRFPILGRKRGLRRNV